VCVEDWDWDWDWELGWDGAHLDRNKAIQGPGGLRLFRTTAQTSVDSRHDAGPQPPVVVVVVVAVVRPLETDRHLPDDSLAQHAVVRPVGRRVGVGVGVGVGGWGWGGPAAVQPLVSDERGGKVKVVEGGGGGGGVMRLRLRHARAEEDRVALCELD
jgi:hypothetical protein